MSHLDAPSPTPTGSSMAPPVTSAANKRPRPSGAAAAPSAAASAAGGTTSTVQPRAKRRKPEESVGPEDRRAGAAKPKDKDDEGEGEIHTKIDFRELPVETLYRYLEVNDLLPRWETSPWSEDPCVAPNALYANPPPAPAGATAVSPREQQPGLSTISPPTNSSSGDVDPSTSASGAATAQLPNGDTPVVAIDGASGSTEPSESNPNRLPGEALGNGLIGPDSSAAAAAAGAGAGVGGEPASGQGAERESEPVAAPPTTRSKTAPARRAATPPPPPKRGVITLSDMYAARDVLAEKANAHWMKGLGGGQNKESETIVNFLYKMKVGPGRLLRVYNPTPAPYPP